MNIIKKIILMMTRMTLINGLAEKLKSIPVNLLIIGSYAIKDLVVRPVKDLDVVCYKKDIAKIIKEIFISADYTFSIVTWAEHNITLRINDAFNLELLMADGQNLFDYLLTNFPNLKVADKPICYAIKMGHIYRPGKAWQKHMDDIVLIRKHSARCSRPVVGKWIIMHRLGTNKRLGSLKTPKLNGVTKKDFFDDKVVKYLEHDNIHKAMSLYGDGAPAYERMQLDDGTVTCYRELWDLMEDYWKIRCVYEEACVIALERHIIPFLKTGKMTLTPENAFKWALMRICTTLCSGYFRAFAVRHYNGVMAFYKDNSDYVEHFIKHINKYEKFE